MVSCHKKSITPELIVVKLLNIIPANKTGACLQDTQMTSMHKDLVPSQLEYLHKTQLPPRDIRFRDKSWWHHVDIHSVLFHFQYISPLIVVMGWVTEKKSVEQNLNKVNVLEVLAAEC